MPLELPGPPGYCNRQLIPYLGNKRALLPRLMPVLAGLDDGGAPKRFLDPFAGSGSVSRLARAMGMRVVANDWEPYSQAINQCWLGLSSCDLEHAFGGITGVMATLEDWNSMHPQAAPNVVPDCARGEPFMARWYAPERTDSPRLGEERLFYTAENAVFLDRARTRIENEYPHPAPGSAEMVRRTVLMATLLLEAATHANTSGVFKAYHRGFGGNGKDALGRILGSMKLELPLIPPSEPATVCCEDAKAFLSGRMADIAYFDPPYNQHQYGSNYHILNTILRWDGKPLPMEGMDDGYCSSKAGIPEIWKATRSSFCSKPMVKSAIHEVLDVTDAAHIVFSWNADGHLAGEELAEMLSVRGRLEIVAIDYTAYRGGRQSASKSNGSREYLFLVDTRKAGTGIGKAVREIAALAELDEAVRATYDPVRVEACFGLAMERALAARPASNSMGVAPEMQSMARNFFRPDLRAAGEGAASLLAGMDADRRPAFLDRLASCACSDIVEQLMALYGVVEHALSEGDRLKASRAMREAPRLIRKLAHRKYEDSFKRFVDVFRDLGMRSQDMMVLASLTRLENLALERISHDRGSRSRQDGHSALDAGPSLGPLL